MTTTTRFRMDNTDGYTQAELNEMNAALDEMIARCPVSSDSKSWQDNVAERVHFQFDAGFRGEKLIEMVDRLPQ